MKTLHLFAAWRAFFVVMVVIGIASSSAEADQLKDATEALERNDYATAFKLLKPLAEAGNQAAQNNLGLLYRDGKGVPEEYSEALKWFRRSAEQGEAAAQTSLWFMYQEGIGAPQNMSEAAKWYKLAADQGDLTARAALVLLSKDLSGFAFIMPPYWILLPQKAITNKKLMFRRYSMLIEKDSLNKLDSKQSDNVLLLGHLSLINSMIFSCESERRNSDVLTIHLPEYTHPKSFNYSEWVSRLEFAFLTTGELVGLKENILKVTCL